MSDQGAGLLLFWGIVLGLGWNAYVSKQEKREEKMLEHLKSINNKTPNLGMSTSTTTSNSSSHPKNVFVGGRMIGMSTSTTTSSSSSHPKNVWRTY